MSWTYDVTKLNETPLFEIRYLIGDTDTNVPLLQDEEINYALTEAKNDINRAAIGCCEAIIAACSKNTDFRLGPMSINLSDRKNNYENLLINLRKKVKVTAAPIFAPPHEAIFDIDLMNCISDHGGDSK